MMLHEEVPIDRCLCLIGLVEKMAIASEINLQFVLQIEKFIKEKDFLVSGTRTTRLPQVLYCVPPIETRPQTEVASPMPSKPNLSNDSHMVYSASSSRSVLSSLPA